MKKLVSLMLILALLLSCASVLAEAQPSAASQNVTWQFKDKEYKLACYWPAPDVFFDTYVLQGLKAFESDFGQSVYYTIGTAWTQDIENQSVEALAAQGYDLFYVFGADTSAANGLYEELYNAGCQVVNYAGLVDDPQKSALTLSSNVYVQAYNSTKKLIEEMGGEGQIINVLENLGDVNTLKRQQGVEAAVAEHESVSVVQTIADIATDAEGFEKVTNALAANQGVKGIIATGGTASKGLASAMTDYYAVYPDAEHIACATMDQSTEVMNAIAAGYVDHTVSQNGWGMGYICPLILMYLKDGWQPINWGAHVDTGYVFITKDNMDSWQTDIEKLSMDILGKIETEILMNPAV